MLIVGKLAAIAVLVALNAFFVACEFSVVKVRTTQLDALLEEGNVRAHFVKHVRGHLDAYLSATQLGITLASLALGWIGEQALASIIQPALTVFHIYSHTVTTSIAVTLAFRRHHVFAHRFRRARPQIHRHFGATACRTSSDATARRLLCCV